MLPEVRYSYGRVIWSSRQQNQIGKSKFGDFVYFYFRDVFPGGPTFRIRYRLFREIRVLSLNPRVLKPRTSMDRTRTEKPTPSNKTATKQRGRRQNLNQGYPIRYTNRADYRYGRNDIPSHIRQFTATTCDVLTVKSVTQILALNPPKLPHGRSINF